MKAGVVKIGLVVFLAISLIACGDSVTGPTFLEGQKALSDITTDRHYSVSTWYLGETTFNDVPVSVFSEQVLNKFTGGSATTYYYVPRKEIDLATKLPAFTAQDGLRRTHGFYYHHDTGNFELYQGRVSSRKQPVELVAANFSEPYSRAEERCLDAQNDADNKPDQVSAVSYAASICFWAKDWESSARYAEKLFDENSHFPRSDRGKALHKHHTIKGRLLLRQDDVAGANEQLLMSAQVDADATMRTFGPNTSLARDLLKAGQRDVVYQYLTECKAFWNAGKLDEWLADMEQGGTPDLSSNLNY